MRMRPIAVTAACCVVLLAGAVRVHAQSPATEMVAKVGFEFTAGDTTFPAGTYRVTRHATGLGELKIAAVGGTDKGSVAVITRLAREMAADQEKRTALVFDVVNGKSYLSEVWMAGQDGFLLRGTPDEHKHVIVKTAE
jgi:hypothetical protein